MKELRIGSLKLDNPFLLAPLAGITDAPMRRLCHRQGAALTYTEMVSAKALDFGSQKTEDLLKVGQDEHPSAVQIFGSDPECMGRAAKTAYEKSGADIVDINMGCPVGKIVKSGDGSALMRDPDKAARIIEEVRKSVPCPVTVKFRKGWDDESVNAVDFARMAEQSGAAAVTVHGRTRMQFYAGSADWDCIAHVREAVSIPVIGNGDVFSPEDYFALKERTGCHGVMVARGAQGNPWIFRQIAAAKAGKSAPEPTAQERMAMALRHARALVEQKGPHAVVEMRKHVAWYVKGMPGAAGIRAAVNECVTLGQLEALLGGACPGV